MSVIEKNVLTGEVSERPYTDDEIIANSARATTVAPNVLIDEQIRGIESRELAPRFAREAILEMIVKLYLLDNPGTTAAQAVEALLTSNAGFAKLKALDDQIKALRAQRV